MKKGNLSSDFRFSTGPLYSKSQLAKAEAYLAEMGLTEKKDEPKLGFRTYAKPGELGSVVAYLHEAGLDANSWQSGVMVFSDGKAKVSTSSIAHFAKEQSIAHTKNPVVRKIRQTLGL